VARHLISPAASGLKLTTRSRRSDALPGRCGGKNILTPREAHDRSSRKSSPTAKVNDMIEFDMSVFERKAKELRRQINQVPYALADAMNEAVANTRNVLVQDTWPSHVTQRNAGFIGRALRRGSKATKRNLQVEIYDSLGRAHLKLHDAGGEKTARGKFAIPVPGAIKRTSRGVSKNKRPSMIIANTPKRALRITDRGIFVGKGGRLQLMYAFAPSASVKPDVPFHDDFREAMTIELRTSFPAFVQQAMKGRRV
jgi:hypothetical protein